MSDDRVDGWRRLSGSCEFVKDSVRRGLWCGKVNVKCCASNCSHPSVSCGDVKGVVGDTVSKSERRTGGLSERHKKAYEYKLKGRSLSWIGKKFKRSKSTVHDWIKKYKAFIKDNKGVYYPNDKPLCKKPNDRNGMWKRLHNDSVSFLIEPISLDMERDVVKLKYDKYKLLKDEDFGFRKGEVGWHIQIFSQKLVIRFLIDIECRNAKACKEKAVLRIKHFLENFSYQGVRFLNDRYEQVSRHYAIIGTDLAKKVIREKRKFFVFDRVDGKKRAEIDFSKRVAEFENPHASKSDEDIETSEAYFDDMYNNVGKFDLPSVTRAKTDLLLSDFVASKKVLQGYMEQIKLHLEVEGRTNEVLKGISRGQEIQNKLLKELGKKIKKLGGFS